MKHLFIITLALLSLAACSNQQSREQEQTLQLEKRTDGKYYVEVHTGEGGYRNGRYSFYIHTALNCPKINKGVMCRGVESIKRIKNIDDDDYFSFNYCATCFTTNELDSLDSILK